MTRERKYRAWIDGKMIYIHQQLSITFFNAPNAIEWAINERVSDGPIYKGDSSYEGSELIEFVGLKDKNDQDIYEGDIINVLKSHKNWKGKPFEIKFLNGSFQMFNESQTAFSYYLYKASKNGSNKCLEDEPLCFEVIGNIYNNPDLLK